MKTELLNALRTFVNQRPGLEFGNYGDVSAYRSEMRQITKQRAEALAMINYVAWHDSIIAEDIIDASKRAFSGRLTINPDLSIDYCTGQYWPTEYRKAVACVMADVLWTYFRTNCDINKGKETHQPGIVDMSSPIRKTARRELGRSIASKYFN